MLLWKIMEIEMEIESPVVRYKRTMVELLRRRKLEEFSLSDEEPYSETLEIEWERMTEEEQVQVDAGLRELRSEDVLDGD